MITCDIKRKITIGILAASLFFNLSSIYALETPDGSITAEPARYTFIDGDPEKYRAHHWMKEGYVGGVKEFSLTEKLPYEISLETEGYAIIDENDLSGFISLKREKVGFLILDYQEFRKYYDGTGGVYRRFSTLRVNELDRNLALDVGHLSLEVGITPEDWPALIFFYEREFKDGVKSRLTWTAVTEGAVTRNIGPSWQELNEIVDIFGLRASHEAAGFSLKGEQRWEFVRSEMTREERSLSTNATASEKKIRSQVQEPEADLLTTTLGAERWFFNEKGFTSAGYRFAHMTNREVENIFEMSESRAITNFTNPKQIRDARADNDYDSHTWVLHLMGIPAKSVNVAAKFKTEIIRRHGNSLYPSDSTPVAAGGAAPDGIIDTTERSVNDSNLIRWGEGFSFRYTGIPRTALYNELEFEQIRNWLSEDRTSLAGQSVANVNEIFSRETLTNTQRGNWTLGANVAPCPLFNFTTQVRHRRNNNDYDDQRETDPGANTARSAFMDEQNIHTNEFTTRVSLRLPRRMKWIQPSFRYQFRDDDFFTRAENEGPVETDYSSHIYTYDVVVQPRPELLFTGSFSRQAAVVETPANISTTAANTPGFHADVYSWLFSMEYVIRTNLVLFSSFLYSRADNFDDFTSTGLPLGVDNERVDLTVGLRYSVGKHITIEPKYGFYHFKANHDVETGDYNAHVLWLDFTLVWV